MLYAVITGASKGIGKAIAERLLKEGFSIAVCSRSRQDLESLETQWRRQYPAARIVCFPADLAKREDVEAFGNEVLRVFERIDILVNNAGIFLPGQLASEPEGNLETLMAVNVYSAYHLTRQLLPRIKEQKSGHIFNLCSVAGLKAYPSGGAYGMSKYAMVGFSENLRLELIPDNIRVTAISPGATCTASWEGSGAAEERMMQAGDIAEMLWAAYGLSRTANVEQIVMRPLGGDL